MSTHHLNPMPENLEPTRATLHQYANVIGVVPRVHAEAREKWWHVSLNVTERGLETDVMALPDGGTLNLRLDLRSHELVVEKNGEATKRIPLDAGRTGTEMGDAVLAAVAEHGLRGAFPREKFESDEARQYDRAVAEGFFENLTAIHEVLAIHRSRLGDSVGPLQLWPHGFDLAFEWFGTRVEEYEEDGDRHRLPAQCNFGFYPGGRPYLYANPWPFEADLLLAVDLPSGADWHIEGWEGSMLNYDEVAGDAAAADRILDYLGAVHEVAAPTLLV
ncbi:DUF5996 family protein [Actinomycetota bacterium]